MEINLFAVLVAAIASMAVGFVWYNPKVFGTYWMKISGKTPETMDKSNMGPMYTFVTIAAVVTAYALAKLFSYGDITTSSQMLNVVLWGWAGIFMALTLSDYLFGGLSKKLWLFQGAYHLVSLVVMGFILIAWR